MQQRAENSKKPTKISKKFIIILLLLLAAGSAWFSKDFINKHFGNFSLKAKNSTAVQQLENPKEHEAAATTRPEPSSNLKPDHQILETKHAENTEGQEQPQQFAQELQNTNTNDENLAQNSQACDDNSAYVDNYRNYLANMNSLISNFLQDKVYSNQIASVRILSLPPSMESVLELLEEYNVTYLVSPPQEFEKVFPVDHKILKRFIKVKKKTSASKEKKKLRANIINNLELFQDYIYSSELQKIFIGQKE